MWFGDLVTMRWFDDVWMKEVFANFMAAKIVNPSFPAVNHELRFFFALPGRLRRRSDARARIRSGSRWTTWKTRATLYGADHLPEGAGCDAAARAAHRRGRAPRRAAGPTSRGSRSPMPRGRTWCGCSMTRTPDDLAAWSRVWIEDLGRPTIRGAPAAGFGRPPGADGDLRRPIRFGPGSRLAAAAGRHHRNHEGPVRCPCSCASGDDVDRGGARPGGRPTFVLAAGGGLGYGRFELDDDSRAWLLLHLPDVADALLAAAPPGSRCGTRCWTGTCRPRPSSTSRCGRCPVERRRAQSPAHPRLPGDLRSGGSPRPRLREALAPAVDRR